MIWWTTVLALYGWSLGNRNKEEYWSVYCIGSGKPNRWQIKEYPSTDYHHLSPSFSTELIIPHPTALCSWVSQGQEPSGLDHFYCNYPEKLSKVEAHYRGGSDHKIIFGVRYTRSAILKPRIVRKRMYKNFKADEFIHAVQNISWWELRKL